VRHPLTPYGVAFVALAAALLLRWLLDPVMGDSLPLVTLFGAVALVVWIGGYRPAALVAILGYLATAYLFIEPRGELGLTIYANVVGLIAYAFTCALIIMIGEAMQRARAAAGERGELLEVTLHSIGDAVITTDIEGRVTSLNPVAEALTGWRNDEAAGKPLETVFRIINEQRRDPVESPATRALREGAIVGLANHTVLIARDGTERTIDDSAAPIRDEQGNVSGCVLVFRDVSDKRRLEKQAASRLADARTLASIVESSDDAIVSKSLDGIIQSWNAAAERVFGYTPEQAIGRHISLVIPPDRIAEEDHIIASLRAGRRVDHFVTERVRSDGRRIHVSLTISPIKDEAGNVVGASKIVRDVTQQRAAEERERKLLADAVASNAKFRALFDQGALFAVMLDVDGTIVEPNRLSVEGSGYAREQVAGRRFWEGPWWASSAALIDQVRKAVADAAAGKTIRAEMPYLAANGGEHTVDLTIVPVRDETGRVLFLAATGSDITERRELEDDLRKLAADLSEVDRRKNEFLATLSHELRNPLAPLRNMVEVLQRADGDAATVRRAVDTMERQLGQLVRLVDDLLDLNRITHDRIDLRKARVDVASVIGDVVNAMRPITTEMGHDVQVDVTNEPLYVDGDAVRLAQVFGNLLNNSSKYTPRGGRIRVAALRRGDVAEISFADNGIGIAADQLERFFELFVQVYRTT
jgi:PAS domain S-box-containing protein